MSWGNVNENAPWGSEKQTTSPNWGSETESLGWIAADEPAPDRTTAKKWCCYKHGRWVVVGCGPGMGCGGPGPTEVKWDESWYCKECIPSDNCECVHRSKSACEAACKEEDDDRTRIPDPWYGGGYSPDNYEDWNLGYCIPFRCMSLNGGTNGEGFNPFGIHRGEGIEDLEAQRQHLENQMTVLRALMRPESQMNERPCNQGWPNRPPGQGVNGEGGPCSPNGYYGVRGDPGPVDPGLNLNGTAHGCLQIRQPYWFDAQKFYAKKIGAPTDSQRLNGPPSCPQRYDYPDPEETNGRPEGYAFIEAYEISCGKLWSGAYKDISPNATAAQLRFAIPPGTFHMPYTNPNIGSYRNRTIQVQNWNQRHESCDFVPGPLDAAWVNPRTGKDGDQYPVPEYNDNTYNDKKHWSFKAGMGEWSKQCACDYSFWIAGLYMMEWEGEGVHRGISYWWSDPGKFSPSDIVRYHHLGGTDARKGQPSAGWNSIGKGNDDWHQWQALLQYEEEKCGEADLTSDSWKACADAAKAQYFGNSRSEDLPRTQGENYGSLYRPHHH